MQLSICIVAGVSQATLPGLVCRLSVGRRLAHQAPCVLLPWAAWAGGVAGAGRERGWACVMHVCNEGWGRCCVQQVGQGMGGAAINICFTALQHSGRSGGRGAWCALTSTSECAPSSPPPLCAQVDFSYYMIRALEMAGLAWDVKRPSESQMERLRVH